MNDMVTGVRSSWMEAAQAVQADTVALRRAIHAEPELGLRLPKTTAKVRAALAGLPLEWKTGPSTTGVSPCCAAREPGARCCCAATWTRCRCPRTPACRSARSVEGTMHACGHDTHTAMLAGGRARCCAPGATSSPARCCSCSSPARKAGTARRFMMEDGLLDDPAPDAAFALHIIAQHAARRVRLPRPGRCSPRPTSSRSRVRGKGGHASMPHDALDPIPVACEIVTALQTFVTRRIDVFDPAVVTIAKIEGGTTDNVIPESARPARHDPHALGRARATRARGHRAGRRAHRARARCEAEVKIDARLPGHRLRRARRRRSPSARSPACSATRRGRPCPRR